MATDEWVRWYWYFKNSGVDIFKIIESAIGVAARSRTKEFMKRRVNIAELLFAIKKGDVFSEAEEEESPSSAKNLKYGCDFNGDQTGNFFTKEEVINKSNTASSDKGLGKIIQGDHEIKPRHIIRLKLRPNPNKEEQSLPVAEDADKIAMARSQRNNSTQPIPTCSKDHEKKLLPTEEEQLMPVPHQVPNVCSAPKLPKKTISKRDEDKQLVVAAESSKKICCKEDKKILPVVNLEVAQTNGGGDHHEGNLCSAAAKSQKQSIQNKNSVGSKHEKFPVTGVKKLDDAEIESSKKTFCPNPRGATNVIKDKKQPTSLNEAALERKLEASKRKLEQGYKQFENAKKRIRIIDLKDLPQQRGVGCKPVQNYRSSRRPLGCIPYGLIR